MRWEKKTPCSPPKHGLELRKENAEEGLGDALPGMSTSPCGSFPKLLCLRSQRLLCHVAVSPHAAVCTTNPSTSFVEAFNDSGTSSSLGMISTASRIPPSVAACSRIPEGAELRLAPRGMCYTLGPGFGSTLTILTYRIKG